MLTIFCVNGSNVYNAFIFTKYKKLYTNRNRYDFTTICSGISTYNAARVQAGTLDPDVMEQELRPLV